MQQPGADADGITGPQADAFGQCVTSKKYADFVSRISDKANRGGILTTPTLLVDGRPVQQVTLAGITAAVVGVIADLALYFAVHTLFATTQPWRWGPLAWRCPSWPACGRFLW